MYCPLVGCLLQNLLLMLSKLGKIFSRQHIGIFFLVFPGNRFDISCNFSSGDNSHEMCNYFPGKIIINFSSAELDRRMVKVKKNFGLQVEEFLAHVKEM